MDQGNVLSHFLFLCCVQGEPHWLHFLFQFQVRYALERSYRDISVWMRNRHTPLLGRMLELDMASLLGDLKPAMRLEGSDNIPRIHAYLYTLPRFPSSV
jgi:hypothetical protein